ncbi:hypothetical protein [Candidatus Uabimicrobium sp. HlEnr_7]|uniref:hypothetical protein n=1 Tax=Candidatus Uabimicrobium helgolandensis TaxID=3095367 RepID=UPI003558D494
MINIQEIDIGLFASIINKNYPSENSAKKSLCSYVSSLHSSSDIVVYWIVYLKRILLGWLPKLFQFVSYPFLPKTNNDLEHFNLKIKKLFRKISGRKNSHLFLLSSGVPLTYFLSANSYFFDFCYSFSHQEMISERNHLFQISKKSAIYSIKNQLEEFLFNLEIVASEKD